MYPQKILHWINGHEMSNASGGTFAKIDPATGVEIARVTRGDAHDARAAVDAACAAFDTWSATSIIQRADILRAAALLIKQRAAEHAGFLACECGKSKKDALGEVSAAVECGLFMASEGRRYYGQTLTSAAYNRDARMVRESIGVGALIVPFNNPLASIAWKAFPALVCGNSVVLKAHEYTPYVPILFAMLLQEAGVPQGVFNVVQGFGDDVGAPLVRDLRVAFISVTGSAKTGAAIVKDSADRLARVSVEAGGKNPFVICDDADIEQAVSMAVVSAFVDAGQRCAAASRIIVFEKVYEQCKELFLQKVMALKIGTNDDYNYGAIISEKRLQEIINDVQGAVERGATLLHGGFRLTDARHAGGFFMQPTVLENVNPTDELSHKEIFGPVVALYRARDFNNALELANSTPYKLTGACHTQNIHRAQEFVRRYHAGVARVNGPTFGSEPHMPFGGQGLSGNGWREPGVQALDFYSSWKQVSIDHNSQGV